MHASRSFIMKTNMGKVDRGIRLVLAVVLVSLFFTDMITGPWGFACIALGAIMATTALVGRCPLYLALKISTCTPVRNSPAS